MYVCIYEYNIMDTKAKYFHFISIVFFIASLSAQSEHINVYIYKQVHMYIRSTHRDI